MIQIVSATKEQERRNMYRSPNTTLRNYKDKSILPYKKGNNQIYRTFKKAINILLTKEYYEGSYNGQYFNQFTKDEEGNDISTIYVRQPEIEEKIKEEIIDTDSDMVKYLVGYEGVGKTTLIRNLFHVFDRKTNAFNNNLVIYISFYSNRTEKLDNPRETVHDVVRSSIEGALTFLSGFSTAVDRVASYDDDFYKSFASYIQDNNSIFANQPFGKPSANIDIKNAPNPYVEYLDRLYDSYPMDYTLTLLKYYLSKPDNKKYKNVYFIFDDLETLPMDFIDEVFYMSMHLDKCSKGLKYRRFKVKQLIALRSYTFRQSKYIKQFGANKISNNDIIIKNQVPSLTEILLQRVSSIEKTIEEEKEDSGIDSKTEKNIFLLMDDLKDILEDTYAKFDPLLLNLTHFNIFNSLQLLVRIITNRHFFGNRETEVKGSFLYDKANYDTDNKNRYSDLFYALAYGDNKLYFDINDYYLMNIMHYHIEDKKETELLGIYIIQYMIKNMMSLSIDDMEGKTRKQGTATIIPFDDCYVIEGDVLLNKLSAFYKSASRNEYVLIEEGFKAMIEHLYNGGALLQDIRKPVLDDGRADGRRYEHGKGVRVYLSLRGHQLYKMLQYNSLLFQVYRDDIDTELENNNIPTRELSVYSRIEYCLSYTECLFKRERKLLGFVVNKSDYIDNFGEKIATVVLMEGISQSIERYFTNETEEKRKIFELYNSIAGTINDFIDTCNNNNHIKFERVKLI